MTSETFIAGCPIPEKMVIGARVRKLAAKLGPGHVEASVEKRGDRIVVAYAWACPLTAPMYSIQPSLEAHLNG